MTSSSISSSSPIQISAQKELDRNNVDNRVWNVFYCKRSNKKHKNYIDGILLHNGKRLHLYEQDSAKEITKTLYNKKLQNSINNSEPLFFGSFQVEIDKQIEENEFDSGICFNTTSNTFHNLNNNNNNNNKKNKSVYTPLNKPKIKKRFKPPSKSGSSSNNNNIIKSEYGQKSKQLKPENDPTKITNPLVLNQKNLRDDYTPYTGNDKYDKRAVCVSKFLSSKLRQHQRDGVLFMYECVMGIRNGINGWYGMILADEMGLGKTLSCITLIYTLINDGPFRKNAIKKCLIVTPSSLVGNWRKEFRKWIPRNKEKKLSVVALEEKNKNKQINIIESFSKYPSKNVLIIGYEMLRSYINMIASSNSKNIDLIVCDEGHRLKNKSGNATINALNRISSLRRILVTGTPVQNELSELYAMCNYCNPNCLNNYKYFNNTYGKPIEKSRDANCEFKYKKIGDERSKMLNKITSSFILRRTSEVILKKYLKPKDEYIIFHQLSSIQILLYREILNNKLIVSFVSSNNVRALQCIIFMRICCCSPKLAYNKLITSNLNIKLNKKLKDKFYNLCNQLEYPSEKIKILMNLLNKIYKNNDKVVVVSNFTSILDCVQSVLSDKQYKYLRLDGSTPSSDRTKLVSKFNANWNKDVFIFLLSSKAGGVGLNLIGANNLVLLDPDWNPATDQQAMARIWRDGQKKRCKIYRFITIGSIEEKILQRQIMKLEISNSVVDRNGKAKYKHKDRHFTKDELKKIFTLKTDIKECETINLLQKNIKEWNIAKNSNLIKTIIPITNDNDIPIIFSRTVDPNTNPDDEWGIKINDDNDNDDSDTDDNNNNNKEYHDSDMDCEDEFQLKPLLDNNDEEDNDLKLEIEEEEETPRGNPNINDNNDIKDEDSDIEIIQNKNKRNNRYIDDSDDDDDDDDNNDDNNDFIEERKLKHNKIEENQKNVKNIGNICIDHEQQKDKLQKEILNMTQQTKGSIHDLNANLDFDFDI